MLNIVEIGTVSERIIKLINHFSQGNKTAFGRAADIQSGVLAGIVGGRESKPGFEILQKLLTAYPTVNPHWLLFGQGEMLISPTHEETKGDSEHKRSRLEHLTRDGDALHTLANDEVNYIIAFQKGEVPLNATREELEVLRNKVQEHLSALMRQQDAASDLYVRIRRNLAHRDL